MGADGDQVCAPIGVFPQQEQMRTVGAVHQQFRPVSVADLSQGRDVGEDAVIGGGGDADCLALRVGF